MHREDESNDQDDDREKDQPHDQHHQLLSQEEEDVSEDEGTSIPTKREGTKSHNNKLDTLTVKEEEPQQPPQQQQHLQDEETEEKRSSLEEEPQGDASLWSSTQLKNKLKSLGYSTLGKRTTLLKRLRSVMHIKKQRELAALSIGHSLVDEVDDSAGQSDTKTPFHLPTPEKKSRYATRRRSTKRRRSIHHSEEPEIIKLNSNNLPTKDDQQVIKPLTKRRRVAYHMTTDDRRDSMKEYDDELVESDDVQSPSSPFYCHEEEIETSNSYQQQSHIKKERKKKEPMEPYSAQFTLSKDDLTLSSNLIRYFNPHLANRKLLEKEGLDDLKSVISEEYCGHGIVKDRNLVAHLDLSDIDKIQTIHIVYPPGNVGSNSVLQQRRRARKQQLQINNLPLQPHQSEPGLVCSLYGVEKFPLLKRLICVGQRLTDISPIASCTSLEHIFLSHNFISIIPSLKKLKNLSALSLSFNQISDISPLSDCKSLKYLNLSFNGQIDDLSPLSECSQLVELDLSGNMLDDEQVSQLASFTCTASLISLKLNCNQIETLRPIATTFPNLEELFMNQNRICDISPLIHLRRLNELDVQCNIALLYSIQVYSISRAHQLLLQQKKQMENLQKRGRGRPPTRQVAPPTVTAAEEDVESLLTASVYDTFVHGGGDSFGQEDLVHTWLQYGRVNTEVLECLSHFGTRCAVDQM